jgi:2'-5' RNA ligase
VRLFVAVEIDEALRRAAAGLASALQVRATQTAPASKITWVPDERRHLTVRFIGQVSDDRVAGITEVLSRPLAASPFAIEVSGVGVFPARGAPTVLWAGVLDPTGGLAALENEVSTRLSGLGFAREDRPFRAHLTLARVREAAGLRARTLLDALDTRRLGTMTVRAITLFESRLSPRGPQYRVIQRTRLGGE